jgi:hypothetical protein
MFPWLPAFTTSDITVASSADSALPKPGGLLAERPSHGFPAVNGYPFTSRRFFDNQPNHHFRQRVRLALLLPGLKSGVSASESFDG